MVDFIVTQWGVFLVKSVAQVTRKRKTKKQPGAPVDPHGDIEGGDHQATWSLCVRRQWRGIETGYRATWILWGS